MKLNHVTESKMYKRDVNKGVFLYDPRELEIEDIEVSKDEKDDKIKITSKFKKEVLASFECYFVDVIKITEKFLKILETTVDKNGDTFKESFKNDPKLMLNSIKESHNPATEKCQRLLTFIRDVTRIDRCPLSIKNTFFRLMQVPINEKVPDPLILHNPQELQVQTILVSRIQSDKKDDMIEIISKGTDDNKKEMILSFFKCSMADITIAVENFQKKVKNIKGIGLFCTKRDKGGGKDKMRKIDELIERLTDKEVPPENEKKFLGIKILLNLCVDIVNFHPPDEIRKTFFRLLDIKIDESVIDFSQVTLLTNNPENNTFMSKRETIAFRDHMTIYFFGNWEWSHKIDPNLQDYIERSGKRCYVVRGDYDFGNEIRIKLSKNFVWDYDAKITAPVKPKKSIFKKLFSPLPSMSPQRLSDTSLNNVEEIERRCRKIIFKPTVPSADRLVDDRVIRITFKSVQVRNQYLKLFLVTGVKRVKIPEKASKKKTAKKTRRRRVQSSPTRILSGFGSYNNNQISVVETYEGEKLCNAISFKEICNIISPLCKNKKVTDKVNNYLLRLYVKQNKRDDLGFQNALTKSNSLEKFFSKSSQKHVFSTLLSSLEKLNIGKKFYEKPCMFWNVDDIIEWSKCCYFFPDEKGIFSTTYLVDDLKPILEVYRKKLNDSKKIYEFIAQIKDDLESSLEDDDDDENDNGIQKWEKYEGYFNVFSDKVISKSQFLGYLLYPKVVMYCEQCNLPLKKLMEMEKKNIRKLIEQYLTIEDFVADLFLGSKNKNKTSVEVFTKVLKELKKVLGDDDGDNCEKLRSHITTIRYELESKFSSEENEYSDFSRQINLLCNSSYIVNENEVLSFRMKLTCYKMEHIKIGKLKKILLPIVDTLNLKEIPPFVFLHTGVILNNSRIDFYADNHVRIKPAESKSVCASFDVDTFYVPINGVSKILKFVFDWNRLTVYGKYHNRKKNCQTFTLALIDFMYATFASDHGKNRFTKLFYNENSFAKKWIKVMKKRNGSNIKRRVLINKEFIKDFPEVKRLKIDGGYYYCSDHGKIFVFMEMFNSPDKFEKLYGKYPSIPYLLKAFCRSFHIEKKHAELVRENKGEDVKKKRLMFEKCYFSVNCTTNRNAFGIEVYKFI